MKKRWHIQTRLLFTLITFTVAILLTVGVAFNLSVHGYIRSRVTAQLDAVSENASAVRKDGTHAMNGRRFDREPDRIFGTTGSAFVVDDQGTLVNPMHGDEEIIRSLSEYFNSDNINEEMHGRIISVGDEKYAVSVTDDPIQTGCYLVSYMDVTQILAFTSRINRVLLVIILVAIFISVILSRHFAKSFAAPVQELSAFACEIGDGNLIPKEFAFRDIEFAGLADSMNHMASELQAAKQKQETLFQNVSHELRTPLTSIRGNAEGIVYGVMEPQTAARVILSESDKLGGMVEDILYLSRIGKAVPDTEAEPIDLREVLSLCVSEQRADAEGRGIAFRFDFDEDPVLLSIREQDALRMFGNLISNAIRYAATAVTLVCRTDQDKILVSVSDDGEGISSEDLPHIFERFYKGKGGRHGIGLAIAQSVAEMYHGELTARNDGGAVFEVRFIQ